MQLKPGDKIVFESISDYCRLCIKLEYAGFDYEIDEIEKDGSGVLKIGEHYGCTKESGEGT